MNAKETEAKKYICDHLYNLDCGESFDGDEMLDCAMDFASHKLSEVKQRIQEEIGKHKKAYNTFKAVDNKVMLNLTAGKINVLSDLLNEIQ